MKKIIIALLLAALVISVFAGCKQNEPAETTPSQNENKNPDSSGDTGNDDEEVTPPDYDFMGNDLTKYVTLGQYKGYAVEVEPKKIITDEVFDTEIKREIILFGQYNEIKEGTVTKEDIVKIKFEGYKGEEKFEGGSGTQEYFTLYNGGGFIDGFADGVVGAEVGKEIDVNVTFPEDYHEESLAGQPVVFKVTVEFIYEAKEMTDELVTQLSGGKMKTSEEFRKQARELMEKDAEATYENAKINAVWEKIFEASTKIELPADVVEEYYNYNLYVYQTHATNYWMTLETFLENIGMTLDDVKKEAEDGLFKDMILYSLIKAENITVSEEEYNTMLKEMAEGAGVTEKEVTDYYTKEELEEMFLYTKGFESVLQWSTFTDKAVENK